MISDRVIKKYGLDARSLKKLFVAKDRIPNIRKLNQLIADRIKNGRIRNLSEYKTWAAVDQAWDTPFAQTTPTIIRGIMDQCKSVEDTMKALEGWGLSRETLFTKVPGGEDGATRWVLNEQVFTGVFIPLVRAYLTVRLSKIFNDRNLTPLFEYPPREFNAENRLICRIITEVVESISINFGYGAILRQFIFNALMYSVAIKFPVEPWSVYGYEDDDGDQVIEKEGVKYVVPHVTRTYYDMGSPLATLNTGTGCSFAGYWTVKKWGDVAMDRTLWNRNVVPHGTNWLDSSQIWYNYFKEVYPCTMDFPTPRAGRPTDRENMEFRYTRTDFDSAFFLTYHFQQLVPSDWGISDYPHEVWMRFTIGGDDTIMFAEVIPYPPLEYMGYDADSGRGKNASLALEIMPFQDLTGNVFSQFIATIKRNLANITFYDTDTVDRTQIETLQTKTAQQVNGLNFVGVSGLQLARSGDSDLRQAFTQINFGQADTNQILLGVNTTINLLERVLGMSAQEVGSSASHQQSKKEVEITNSSSSNRLAYTASFIDEGIDAWKRHLVEAAIEYMDGGDVEVSIPVNDFPDLEANLESIGFKFAKNPPVAGQPKVAITGKLSKAKHLNLIQIVANRSDAVRQNDMQVGQLMMQTIQSIANSPLLSQVVAPESLVEMLEYSARLAGADDDFRIKLNNQAMLANALQGVVQKIQQEIMGAVEKEVVQPIAQEMAQMKQGDAQNMQQVAQEVAQLQKNMQQIMQMLAQAGAPGVQPQPQPGPPLPPQLPPTPPQQPIPAPQPQTFAPPAEPGPAATSAIPNSLIAANPQHREIAKQFLVKAKGRKKRARELAAQAGYKM